MGGEILSKLCRWGKSFILNSIIKKTLVETQNKKMPRASTQGILKAHLLLSGTLDKGVDFAVDLLCFLVADQGHIVGVIVCGNFNAGFQRAI